MTLGFRPTKVRAGTRAADLRLLAVRSDRLSYRSLPLERGKTKGGAFLGVSSPPAYCKLALQLLLLLSF